MTRVKLLIEKKETTVDVFLIFNDMTIFEIDFSFCLSDRFTVVPILIKMSLNVDQTKEYSILEHQVLINLTEAQSGYICSLYIIDHGLMD